MSHGAICAKGLSGINALYHPERNKYPLIRVGKRGENKWKRISWKEAIDTIAEKMMEVRAKYGAESVLVTTAAVATRPSVVSLVLPMRLAPRTFMSRLRTVLSASYACFRHDVRRS